MPLRLTIAEIVEKSGSRARRWHPGGVSDWSPLEWAGAMAGEAGEACNAAKKLKRITDGIKNINHERGRSLKRARKAEDKIGLEIADTIIYAVILARRVNVDIEAVLMDVFNTKSKEYGFPERLRKSPTIR